MDISIIIKYFFIALCGFYVICKLQNVHPSMLQIFLIFVGAILSAIFYILFKSLMPNLYIMALVIPFLLLSKIILRQPFKKIVPLGLTSIALSFAIAIIGVFVVGGITSFIRIFYNISNDLLFQSISFSVIGFIQILFTFLIFKIKRFSRGIPNVDKFLDSDLSTYISITIILFMAFAEIENNDIIYLLLIAFFIAFFGVTLFFVWKMRFNKIYINRQKKIELEELDSSIQRLDRKNKEITAENERMAAIIHRDNKTISAFISTLSSISTRTKDRTTKKELSDFLDYLYVEHKERQLILNSKNNTNVLPKTNIFPVDSILDFMKNRATQNNIDFKFVLNNGIENLTPNIIQETDLVTLLADLLENAIFATKNSENKQIEVQFSQTDGIYQLRISDSGIPFDAVVLQNFGTKKITTHKDEGGSGIGLVTIYGIIKKTKASLYIIPNTDIYTKTISILFDNRSRLSIASGQ